MPGSRTEELWQRTLLAAAAAASLALAPQPAATVEPWADLARAIVSDFAAQRFAAVEGRFDPAMRSALPAGRLAAIWTGLLAQTGGFQEASGTREEDVAGYHVVLVACRFEKALLDVKLVFDGERRLAGLFFLPHAPAVEWSAPPYAVRDAFLEREILVGEPPWQLPGTLTLPKGSGPFAAVVLVHGSGPHDQDETIGPNKPFKDLAWGLASRGVAVVRYAKRTHQHAVRLRTETGTFTVREETVDDARAAVALASRQPEIDPRRVYVLGHSLGGTLAPRIAGGAARVAGLVLMAGGVRPLQRAVVEQLRYLASLGAADQASIRAAEAAARQIESPELGPTTMVEFLGASIPGSYFLDFRGYDPPRAAAALGLPVLVLQAERDYQVTLEEHAAWTAALASNPRSSFKVYPGLYHLFMPSGAAGSGPGAPTDYERPGHVEEAVLKDIAAWIDGLRSARP